MKRYRIYICKIYAACCVGKEGISTVEWEGHKEEMENLWADTTTVNELSSTVPKRQIVEAATQALFWAWDSSLLSAVINTAKTQLREEEAYLDLML